VTCSIKSDIVKVSKNVTDFENVLSEICNGAIIRWAIIEVGGDFYKISFSYKKDALI